MWEVPLSCALLALTLVVVGVVVQRGRPTKEEEGEPAPDAAAAPDAAVAPDAAAAVDDAPLATLDHRDYYRMPWSLTDNAMSWLEITTRCNIYCDGCYRDAGKDGHKSLEEIAQELELFKKFRKSDGMSIAGGDPLIHPQIVEIVRMVRQAGYKPLLNTNGMALTPQLLHELVEAGAASFTFHVDTTQKRDDLQADTEAGYAPLRLKYADMLAEEGGATCGYNVTITRKNYREIPEMVRWAAEHADRVHSIHFISYNDFGYAHDFDLFANGRRITVNAHRTNPEYTTPSRVTTPHMVAQIRQVDPGFAPAAYLSGTCDPQTMKWTFANRFVLAGQTLGYAGPRFMELAQKLNHLFEGKWIAITSPKMQASGRAVLWLCALFDRGVRRALWRFIKAIFKEPRRLLRRVQMQTILLLQPLDYLEDGRMNMCDGCPDMTVHEGKLYWSCRLEEIKEHGSFLTAAPRVARLRGKRHYYEVVDEE